MYDRDYRKIQRRIWVLAGLMFCAFLGLGIRAFTLQIIEGEQHFQKAESQTSGSVIIQPRRGLIYDRQMRILATNSQVPTLVAHPRLMSPEERAQAKSLVIRYFGSSDEVLSRLDRDLYKVNLERRVPEDRAARFRRAISELPPAQRPRHLTLLMEDKRVYPSNKLAAPLLGFTNIDMVGRMGLERAFDEALRGEAMRVVGQRDASGKVTLEALNLTLNVPAGKHLVLTIDKAVQYVAERVLRDTVEKHRADFAVAVVMDPRDGAIYAMAQYPSFNPNQLRSEDIPYLHNFATEWTFEPGSTLKPFVVAQALETARFVPEDMIDCGGGQLRVGPKIIRDVKRYDRLSVRDVVVKSSNIGVTRIGQDLGAVLVHDILQKFGFGARTDIPLPSESRGILTPPKSWYPVDLANISFGQGVNVTAIQLATAMAAIANGGILVQPRLVHQELGPDGDVVRQFDPVSVRRVISEDTARIMREMLRAAASDGGTGVRAQIAGCPVAGKTGTSEKLHKNAQTGERRHWTSSFVGYLPADDPQLVILVVVDEPKSKEYYGGEVPAPAFRKIALEVAPMLGICAQRQEMAEVQ